MFAFVQTPRYYNNTAPRVFVDEYNASEIKIVVNSNIIECIK